LRNLDARQEQISIIKDLSEREMVQEWTENKRYSRGEILAVVTVAETSKPTLTRSQIDTLLSPIPRNLTALLTTNELMAGAQIEEFLSHLVSSNTNMSFMGTDFVSGLLHQV
jgi:hypothetical protein